MEKKELIDVLIDLKDNRRLSSESEAIIKPFVGKSARFTFSFLESSKTFSSRLDQKYANGKTVLANFVGQELECSILIPSSHNDLLENLTREDEFDFNVKILALDNLYQRIILGFLTDGEEDEDREKNDSVSKEIVTVADEADKTINVTHKEDIGIGNIDSTLEAEISESHKESEQNESERVQGSTEVKTFEEVTEKKSSPVDHDHKVKKESDSNKAILSEDKNIESQKPSIQPEEPKSERANFANQVKKENDPPPIPSLQVQKKAKEIDFRELERIRDKRYDQGVHSLTDEEKEILSLSKNKQLDNSINTPQNSKRKINKIIADDQKDSASMGCRILMGIFVAMFAMNSLAKGWWMVAIVSLFVAWGLVSPAFQNSKK